MTFKNVLIAAFLVALGWAAPDTLSSQQNGQGPFGETVDVQLVNVEVVVTDRSGQRVEGLEASDFRLMVDGVATTISHFTEIREGVMARQAVAMGSPVEATLGGLVGTNFLVFIDEFYAIGAQRDLVISRMRDALDTLRPADRMAIVAYNGESLDVLADWTSDRSLLRRVFADARERRTFGLLRSPERYRLGVGRAGRSEFADVELEMEASAIVAAVRAMPRPRGRNVLMLLAGTWPTGPGFDIEAGLPTLARNPFRVDDVELLRPVIETANLLGYTIYPVDLAGLRTGVSDFSSDPLGASAGGDLMRWGSLRRIAIETGGRTAFAGNRLSSLQRAVDDTRSYYWIGFTPERQHDGSLHEIEVDVAQSGLKTRSRTSYRDLTRHVELATKLESELLLQASRSDGSLRLAVVDVQKSRGRKMEVVVEVAIPWQEITFLSVGDQSYGQGELRFAVMDSRGVMSQVAVVPLVLSNGSMGGDPGFRYDAELLLRREAHDLVVTFYDEGSGRTSSELVQIKPR